MDRRTSSGEAVGRISVTPGAIFGGLWEIFSW
jgi:hypothetical protein